LPCLKDRYASPVYPLSLEGRQVAGKADDSLIRQLHDFLFGQQGDKALLLPFTHFASIMLSWSLKTGQMAWLWI